MIREHVEVHGIKDLKIIAKKWKYEKAAVQHRNKKDIINMTWEDENDNEEEYEFNKRVEENEEKYKRTRKLLMEMLKSENKNDRAYARKELKKMGEL